MARVEIQVKYCDPCYGKTPAVTTRIFEWFGARYSIDVCEKHDLGLRNALDRWTTHATELTARLAFQSPLAAPTGLYEKPVALPSPKDRWRFSRHAEQRMVQRQISRDVAREVAEHPDASADSEKQPRLREHYGKGLVVVVDPRTSTIITVAGEQQVAVG